MKRILIAAAALVAINFATDAQAAVPGSKVTVTFEGLVRGRQVRIITGDYDGCSWDASISAAGRGAFKTDPGFQAVIHNRVAGVIQSGAASSIVPASGLVSIQSGHFAAFGGGGVRDVTFNAYRNGVVVGTLFVNQMKPVDNFIQFDRTFSRIDRFEIIGQVAFDNLVFKFGQ